MIVLVWAGLYVHNNPVRSHWFEYSIRFNNAKKCFREQGNTYYWLDGEPITEEEFWL